MGNEMNAWDAVTASIRSDVYLDVFGIEFRIITACRIGNKVCFTVENQETGSNGSYDVPFGSNVHVIRIES